MLRRDRSKKIGRAGGYAVFDLKRASEGDERPGFPARRMVLKGIGAMLLLAPARPGFSAGDEAAALRAVAAADGAPRFENEKGPKILRFAKGSPGRLSLRNDLGKPARPDLFGARPLAEWADIPPGETASLGFSTENAGTFWLRLRALDDAGNPTGAGAGAAVLVDDAGEMAADRDAVLVFDRQVFTGPGFADRFDGRAPSPVAAVNGERIVTLALERHERIRLRVINAAERLPCTLALPGAEMRVIALDGQPSEPFLARDDRIGLGPGNRADLILDGRGEPATGLLRFPDSEPAEILRLTPAGRDKREAALAEPGPLPANTLPASLDLRNALRIDINVAAPRSDTAALFRAARGRVVVLALSNPSQTPWTFRLAGHSARLLDALDDGWKPFWLDTIMVGGGRTERIAFRADFAGRWRMEAISPNPAVPDWTATFEVG